MGSEDSLTKSFFDASAQLQLGHGATFLYWSDAWLEGARLADLAPDLVVAVSNNSRRRRTVASAMLNQAWVQDITGAPTILVIIQYIELYQRLQSVQLSGETADSFIWRWEA
jgi:hypothetical protein